ncbi:hypothetical protein SynNOUM97013_01206 [Synechococcus sp. NOUM97013]|nr:hypothetical protein SynNOUM97013_01206 [Synechococcus sp. NOUM97013]
MQGSDQKNGMSSSPMAFSPSVVSHPMEFLSIGIQDCWLIKSSLAADHGGSGELSKRRAPFLSDREIELHASTSIGDKT